MASTSSSPFHTLIAAGKSCAAYASSTVLTCDCTRSVMCSSPRISFSGWKSLSSAATRLPMFLARSPIRSRSVATRIAPTISRRSIAIGWRRAMVNTARSSMARCRLSISASTATTRWPSATSRRISASTESTIMRSASPPISATSRVSSWRSLSNALAVCSEAIIVSSAKSAGNVVLRAPIARRGKDLAGVVELDQLAEIHERGLVGDARGLLHVVRDDRDRVVLGQFLDQFLDLGGRNRIERRARLVEQDHLGTDRDGAGDAEPLLLAAREAQARGIELVLDLVPQCAAAQRLLDPTVHLGLGNLLIEADAEGDVLVDRHRKRRRLLEHHADPRPQQIEIETGIENVGLVQHQLADRALPRIEIVHPVEDAQQGRLAAARRSDEGGDAIGAQREIDVLQRMVFAVVEIQVAGRHLRWRFGERRRVSWPAGMTHGKGNFAHFALLSAPRIRAPTFRASTVKVISNAPLQANCFQ